MPVQEVRELMGMPVTIVVAENEERASLAVEEAFADFAVLDRTFSPFHPESAVSRNNRGELQLGAAGELVARAVDLCRLYQQATDGYFSAWPGERFDPSGLVKGWAIDRAASILFRHGCRDFYVDAGGDVQACGLSIAGGPWRVGIRHPVQRHEVVRVILAADLAVATSGTYEKGDHILNPHTGAPADGWLSFTVIGPDILTADVYATAAFAMGEEGLLFIERTPGYEAYAIDRRLIGSWTSGFDSFCERAANDAGAQASVSPGPAGGPGFGRHRGRGSEGGREDAGPSPG
ncbi:MAG: FAD:protein FMN transferase [Candidatus Dormibacteraeota bacterium]|nr:FAD:protein FMN transferase [Candidatus Dormibacteraeota bacterium]